MDKIIIEARINEYEMRDKNPHVPWTCEEIVEEAERVREAGASILHFHVRTPEGLPDNRVEAYGEIIRKVREKTDLILLPTLGYNTTDKEGAGRMEKILALAADPATKPDIIPLDMGCINIDQYDAQNRRFLNKDAFYNNTTEILEQCAAVAKENKIKVKMVCWDVGFVRRSKLFLDMGLIEGPGYFLFLLTEGKHITGHPATKYGVKALRLTLPEEECAWTVCCFGGNLFKVADYVLEKGGHIAVGIGDYPYPELGFPTNAQLVAEVKKRAAKYGKIPATPKEARQILKL